MKAKTTLALIAIPVGFAAYVVFHPGVAYAETSLASLAPSPVLQGAGSYTADPLHTSIGFDIQHLGLSRVQGRFTKVEGHIKADPKSLSQSGVEFTVQTESVDTAVAPRDAHLRTPDFFDAAKYPQMTFKSTAIRKRGKGYLAEGVLTIKAVSKPISIPFKAYGPIQDPWGNSRIGVVAEPFTINRKEFGINYNDKLPDGTPAVGDDVTVRVSLEATLDKAAR